MNKYSPRRQLSHDIHKKYGFDISETCLNHSSLLIMDAVRKRDNQINEIIENQIKDYFQYLGESPHDSADDYQIEYELNVIRFVRKEVDVCIFTIIQRESYFQILLSYLEEAKVLYLPFEKQPASMDTCKTNTDIVMPCRRKPEPVRVDFGCSNIGCIFHPDRKQGTAGICNCPSGELSEDERSYIRGKLIGG